MDFGSFGSDNFDSGSPRSLRYGPDRPFARCPFIERVGGGLVLAGGGYFELPFAGSGCQLGDGFGDLGRHAAG